MFHDDDGESQKHAHLGFSTASTARNKTHSDATPVSQSVTYCTGMFKDLTEYCLLQFIATRFATAYCNLLQDCLLLIAMSYCRTSHGAGTKVFLFQSASW